MGLIVFLAVVGALTTYAFHILFDAPGWGLIAALALFILGMTASNRVRPTRRNDVESLPIADKGGLERLPTIRNANAVLAASIAVAVGIGLGWLLRGIDNDESSASSFVRLENERLLATAPLKTALDTIPSGDRLAPVPGGTRTQFRARMTFQNQSRDYCRLYELAPGAKMGTTGIACRIPSGDWSVVLQTPQVSSVPGRTMPASGQNAVLDAAVDALIYGNPLVAETEAAIIRNGWRR